MCVCVCVYGVRCDAMEKADVEDSAGNAADTASRIVQVETIATCDNIAPIIFLNGEVFVQVIQEYTYVGMVPSS